MNSLFEPDRGKLIILGILFIGMALFTELPRILTSKEDLTNVSGKLNTVTCIYENVQSNNGFKSIRATLTLYLKGCQKKFQLQENIGQRKFFEKYDRIKQGLQNSNQVTVWFNKSEHDDLKPEVLQIDADDSTLLQFKETSLQEEPFTIFLLITGFGSIIYSLIIGMRGKFA